MAQKKELKDTIPYRTWSYLSILQTILAPAYGLVFYFAGKNGLWWGLVLPISMICWTGAITFNEKFFQGVTSRERLHYLVHIAFSLTISLLSIVLVISFFKQRESFIELFKSDLAAQQSATNNNDNGNPNKAEG